MSVATSTHSLLDEPILGVTGGSTGGGGPEEALSLPALLARLGAGERTEMSALQPHQYPAWHAFLVQLAALVLHRTGDRRLDRSAEAWRRGLLALTDGREEPWCLVVEDLSEPAFFQPPVPEGTLEKFKGPYRVVDELEVLVLTKNHDVKAHRLASPRPEHWIYALVNLQTFQGYSGRMNYGIARMNGGLGSRPLVGLAPSRRWEDRFGRDVAVWLGRRENLERDFPYAPRDGHALLWLVPWDGTESLPLGQLDPFFVEICRRVRFTAEGDEPVVRTAPSKVARVEAADRLGNLGDVWVPVRTSDSAAMTLSAAGLTYQRVQELLFAGTGGDWGRPAALEPRPEDGEEPWFCAHVLVRGQGKTEGYHERWVPISRRARNRLLRLDDRKTLREIAGERVARAAAARLQVLKPALCRLHQPGDGRLRLDDPWAGAWSDRLEPVVDRIFFEQLWRDLEETDEDREAMETRWAKSLYRELWRLFVEARGAVPVPEVRRYGAEAAAESLLWNAARKHLGLPYEDRNSALKESAKKEAKV